MAMKQKRQPLIDLEPVPIDFELPAVELDLPVMPELFNQPETPDHEP